MPTLLHTSGERLKISVLNPIHALVMKSLNDIKIHINFKNQNMKALVMKSLNDIKIHIHNNYKYDRLYLTIY